MHIKYQQKKKNIIRIEENIRIVYFTNLFSVASVAHKYTDCVLGYVSFQNLGDLQFSAVPDASCETRLKPFLCCWWYTSLDFIMHGWRWFTILKREKKKRKNRFIFKMYNNNNNNNNLSVCTFNTIIFLTDELIIAPLFKHLLLSHYDYQLNLFIWWDASHLGNHYSLPTPASLNCKLKQTNTRRGHNEKCEQKQKRHEWEERWKGLKRGSGKWQVEVQVMEMEKGEKKEKADSVRVMALWGEAGLLANRRRGWG